MHKKSGKRKKNYRKTNKKAEFAPFDGQYDYIPSFTNSDLGAISNNRYIDPYDTNSLVYGSGSQNYNSMSYQHKNFHPNNNEISNSIKYHYSDPFLPSYTKKSNQITEFESIDKFYDENTSNSEYNTEMQVVQNTIESKASALINICYNCKTQKTPSWRRTIDKKNILCNACGLYQRLHNRDRPFRTDTDGKTKAVKPRMYAFICYNCNEICKSEIKNAVHDKILCENCNYKQREGFYNNMQTQRILERKYYENQQHKYNQNIKRNAFGAWNLYDNNFFYDNPYNQNIGAMDDFINHEKHMQNNFDNNICNNYHANDFLYDTNDNKAENAYYRNSYSPSHEYDKSNEQQRRSF